MKQQQSYPACDWTNIAHTETSLEHPKAVKECLFEEIFRKQTVKLHWPQYILDPRHPYDGPNYAASLFSAENFTH